MNEQAVLAELARLYLISRELEQALEQARTEKCPEPKSHEHKPPTEVPAGRYDSAEDMAVSDTGA